MNCLVSKKSGKITVDKLCGGPPKYLDGKKKADIAADKAPKPGTIEWEEWLSTFSPAQRERILKRHNTPRDQLNKRSAMAVRKEREAAEAKAREGNGA